VLQAPDAVTHVDDFTVTTTIVNTGDEKVKLLKDPRTPLSSWATNTFVVTNQAGDAPKFDGVAVRYIPTKIATSTNDNHFTVLAPGESVDVVHEGTVNNWHTFNY
jgi:peptidyl-Lys metalloendopeptidase